VLDALVEQARLHQARGELNEALKTCEAALLQFPEDARIPQVRLLLQRLRSRQGGGGG